MIFWQNLLRLVRRRNIALTAVGVAVGLAAAAFFVTPARYTSSAVLVLTSSAVSPQSLGGDPNNRPQINPLLNYNEGLNTALAILVQAMNTDEMLDRLGADTKTKITITDIGGAEFLGNKGPFLFLTGQSSASPDAARDIVVRAEQRTRQELVDRQQSLKAPESQLITALDVVEPTPPTTSSSARLQTAGFAFGLGLVLVIGGAYVLEAVRLSRHRRAAGEEDAVDGSAAGPPVPQPRPSDVPVPSYAPSVPTPAAVTANGHATSRPVNGAPVNGAAVNGTPVNGATTNGAAVNGVPANGVPVSAAPATDAPARPVPTTSAPSVDAPTFRMAQARPPASNGRRPSPSPRPRLDRRSAVAPAPRSPEPARNDDTDHAHPSAPTGDRKPVGNS